MENLARNSAARLIAYVVTLGMGFIYSVVTARWLGPADRGILSTLTFLSVVIAQLACLGLGEAAIVLVGQKRASIQRALSAAVGALALTSVVGIAVLAAAAAANFHADLDAVWPAVIAACAGVPVAAYVLVLTQIVNVHERFVATSFALVVQFTVSAAAAVVLVAVLELSVLGAVLALVAGAGAALLVVASLLRRRGLSVRPAWDASFLRRAVPYGVKVQISGPPPLTDRVDLLLVYALAGQAAAGHYSVALGLAALVGMVPLAFSHVSFPRLARIPPAEAADLTRRTCRYGLGAALVSAAFLAVAIPFGLPLVFGEPYAPAVAPALVLVAAYVLSSAQWLLGRATAARGQSGILAWSYGANLVVIVALDFALIPALGVTGAALAALAGAGVGLIICLVPYAVRGRRFLGLTDLLPTPGDLRHLTTLARELVAAKAGPTAAASVGQRD